MNKIITKDITEEITVIPSTEYAYLEVYISIEEYAIYKGTIWGIQHIQLLEDGTLTAQVNNDPTAIILHDIKEIQIKNITDSATQYIVNIECNI